MNESTKKGDLIKRALKIVDTLADLDIEDKSELIDLIEDAEKLKKNSLWKLT